MVTRAFLFLGDGDRQIEFFDDTVLFMLRMTLLCFLSAAALGVVCTHEAEAADFYVETLSTIDGGSSPTSSASNAQKYQGNEVAIRCNYDARLTVCDRLSTTCTAGAHGQYLDQNKTFPVCVPMNYGLLAILPTDAGVSTTCDLSTVNPKQTCPP